jgi:hypothetical protein
MKKFNLNQIAIVLVSFVLLIGCVKDDDFSIPEGLEGITEYPNQDAEFNTISSVLGSYGSNNNTPFTYPEEGPGVTEKYTEGYVVSSDEGGNFYKELIIQDAPENPTAAIVIQADKNPLFTQYEFGRKVFVKLNGLTVGESNGVLQLGRLDGEDIARIPSTLVVEHITRTAESATIVPKEVSISDFSDELESQYIKLTDMQFISDLVVGKTTTFAAESSDSFDGERQLESCATGNSVILSTSTFSDFKSLNLPANRGSIEGVLTRDFFDDFYTIYINTPEGIDFEGDRCDPVFEEKFNSAVDNTELDIEGWINYAEAGSEVWTEQVFSGNGYAEFNPYNSGDASNIGWLITPAIDLDAQEGEFLTFETEHAYPDSGHDPLDVLISTDFDGDPNNIATATWTELTFDVSYIVDFGTWYNFTSSGNVDISGYSGNAYIAFRYTGSDTSNQNMTLHVDNVKVSVP